MADRVSLAYLLGASAIFLLHWNSGADYRSAVVRNVAFAAFLLLTGRERGRGLRPEGVRPEALRPEGVVRGLYPLILTGFIYVQVGLFIHILFRPPLTFDHLVERWDAALFGLNPHMWLHRALPGRFWAEVMHLLYVLFYPLLVWGFLLVLLRRRHDYERFAFVYICAFLSFCAIFVAFPADGPMPYRQGLFGGDVLFSNLVDYLFSHGIPLTGGAFPSAHVGQSVVLLLLLLPLSRFATAAAVLVIIGIGVSMGYASVHYSIDAVAGAPAGAILYFLWNGVYRRWVRPR
ncbi:MAG: hypothetical protein EA427_05055 [Spirochaetaceae bacterium]|nr:MAG: hypothetical protein EA427_05055 [Spirochaetaceae bacterium]